MKESKFYQEILDEGRVQERRQALVDTLEERFGPPVAEEFAPRLQALADLQRLAWLQRLAVRCAGVEEFRRRFEKT